MMTMQLSIVLAAIACLFGTAIAGRAALEKVELSVDTNTTDKAKLDKNGGADDPGAWASTDSLSGASLTRTTSKNLGNNEDMCCMCGGSNPKVVQRPQGSDCAKSCNVLEGTGYVAQFMAHYRGDSNGAKVLKDNDMCDEPAEKCITSCADEVAMAALTCKDECGEAALSKDSSGKIVGLKEGEHLEDCFDCIMDDVLDEFEIVQRPAE
eukprot:gnl/TRDRNA2_/TRDRNA2_196433_c0_seq1.p1 gnl/TRDRNA2_/TRDRNA2_196433_c0~~gnl/TRDRNA2_/TRDRNA2_196433_c0_seq1.p1  ORF type:complete len:209 (+),score=46.42 gnl/TRDRNA2_/TRDRNA2_196433_c0_seq1:80-706(+)